MDRTAGRAGGDGDATICAGGEGEATICALATPIGEGALGIIRLSGARALELLRLASGRQRFEPRVLQHVVLRDPASGEVLDRVLACAMPAPRSYTGEHVAEVHAHGGAANLSRLLELFLRLGARQAAPGEFTRRAFLNGRLDLTQAEAVAEVIAARSERELRNAQGLLAGALGERVRELRGRALALAAGLEAALDFAEDTRGVAPEPGQLAAEHHALERELTELAASHRAGRRLASTRVGLVGPVNAGKSSLFNRLLGSARALVSSDPGTTRDYLEADVDRRGHRITLLDTAGSRGEAGSTPLEEEGQRLALPQLESCDLLLCVVDLSDPEPARALRAPPGPDRLIVANKADLAPVGAAAALREVVREEVVATSALTGEGLPELLRLMEERLHLASDATETVVVTSARQAAALQAAASALAAGREGLERQLPVELVLEHLREALSHLDGIVGDRHTEAVLDEIFGRFCVGK